MAGAERKATKQKRCMELLLRLLPKLTRHQFEYRLRQLYFTDSVDGPEAVAWGLQVMANRSPPGPDRRFFLEQMDSARNDAALMRKVRKGWQTFGVDDPWWVVHQPPLRQLARYNSEPMLHVSP